MTRSAGTGITGNETPRKRRRSENEDILKRRMPRKRKLSGTWAVSGQAERNDMKAAPIRCFPTDMGAISIHAPIREKSDSGVSPADAARSAAWGIRLKVLWLCNIMLPVFAKANGLPCTNREGWLSGGAENVAEESGSGEHVPHVVFGAAPASVRESTGHLALDDTSDLHLDLPDLNEATGRDALGDEARYIDLAVCCPVPAFLGSVRQEVDGVIFYGFREDLGHPERHGPCVPQSRTHSDRHSGPVLQHCGRLYGGSAIPRSAPRHLPGPCAAGFSASAAGKICAARGSRGGSPPTDRTCDREDGTGPQGDGPDQPGGAVSSDE